MPCRARTIVQRHCALRASRPQLKRDPLGGCNASQSAMASLKKLQAVAHDIAHHAQSSLSWIHPHLGEACAEAGVLDTSVELLMSSCPRGLAVRKPLELALSSLREKFFEMLSTYGLSREDVSAVRLEFRFSPLPRDNFSCAVRSVITARTGRVYDRTLF